MDPNVRQNLRMTKKSICQTKKKKDKSKHAVQI